MRQGFTLVETLLYLGLFSLFIVVVSLVFVSAIDVQLSSEATSAVEQDGRYILARLWYDVHRADSIAVPAGAGQSANQLQLAIAGVTHTYVMNGNNLEAGNVRLNNFDTKISGLTITRIGNGVTVNFTVTGLAQEAKGAQSKSFRTTVGLR